MRYIDLLQDIFIKYYLFQISILKQFFWLLFLKTYW